MTTVDISTAEISKLSWGQRLALINAYHPSDEQACHVLGITAQELATARSLVTKGVFQIDDTMNVEPYGVLFGHAPVNKPKIDVSPKSSKKRGRKGDKIQRAFAAIPETPVSAEQFIKEYGISMPVLRQFKRFDKTNLPGQVNVRKRDGVLMVWRSNDVTNTNNSVEVENTEQ